MNIKRFEKCQTQLCQLAIDDPAVGQGINATNGFGKYVAQCLEDLTGFSFIDASDKFEELNTYNIMVELSGKLSTLAISLMEIMNGICLLNSGCRCGTGRLILFETDEKNSFIHDQMNSTAEYEPIIMAASVVMNNHFGLSYANSIGNSKLNLFKPLIIKNVVHSIDLLHDVCNSFSQDYMIRMKFIEASSTNKNKTKKIMNEYDQPLIIEGEKNPSNMKPPLVGLIELVDNLEHPNTSGRKQRIKNANVLPTLDPSLSPPPPLDQQQRFSTMMNNNLGIESIHLLLPPPSYSSHHPMQSNDVRPTAPPAQQQQHPTEAEEIRQLAEELKRFR